MEKSASNHEAQVLTTRIWHSVSGVLYWNVPLRNDNVLAHNYNHHIYLPRPDIVFNIAPIQEAGVWSIWAQLQQDRLFWQPHFLV